MCYHMDNSEEVDVPMASKHIQIANQLRSEISAGVYNETRALPTEQALTERFHVSRQTIRQALSILVSENLITRRQGSGTYLTDYGASAFRRMRRVAVVTTYISDYIFPQILRAVQEEFSQNNCSMALYDTRNQIVRERQILQDLLLDPPDGILIEGTKTALPSPNVDLFQKFRDKKIPMVFFNACPENFPNAVAVMDDNFNGGYLLGNYLLELGHRRIAGFFKNDDIQGQQRYFGFISALRDANMLNQELPIFWYSTETFDMIISKYTVHQISDCTAVICYNDMAAFNLINLLLQEGRRVPDDISVVSFDNSHYSELSAVKITSLSHESLNTGRIAAEKLIAFMELGGHREDIRSEEVPWVLKERESSCALARS